MASRSEVLAKLVAIAESYVGAVATEKRFLDLVAPHGPAEARSFFAEPRVPGNANSSCGVVGVGFIRELARAFGLDVDELDRPMSLEWWAPVVALAKTHGVFYVPDASGARPGPGCLYHVQRGNAQHWRTVVGGAGDTLETVDGGAQTSDGHQRIDRARPTLRGFLDVTSGKQIVEWIDVVGLVMALDAVVERFLDGSVTAISSPTASSSPVPDAALHGAGAIAELAGLAEGIDVSSLNGPIRWTRVPAEVRFVYVRAGVGLGSPDPRRIEHANGARATGRDVGVYGVALPGRWDGARRVFGGARDAVEQARELARAHRELGCTLRPWIDAEPTDATQHLPGAEWAAALLEYGETLESEGLPPVLYTYPAWWSSHAELCDEPRFARWPLAIADYRGGARPWVPGPWKDATIWQYAASAGTIGLVEGVAGAVDRDRVLDPRGLAALRI